MARRDRRRNAALTSGRDGIESCLPRAMGLGFFTCHRRQADAWAGLLPGPAGDEEMAH